VNRKKILHRIADRIVARADEIAIAECWDTGQAHRFMSKAALRGAENFRFFADRAPSARDGQTLPSPTLMNVTTRVPIGPVGVITPWNTPFMLSTWKIAPALAAGCTVVHKPAEFSPVTARILMEIAEEAGLPAGVWNLVNGFGEDAGKALTEHPDIKAIAFVGESSRTGSMIMKQGADTLKRVHFELGGKNPVIVFDDADLDRALDAAIFMIYSLNGERCTSSSRLLVQDSIADEFQKSWSSASTDQGRPSARPRNRDRPADPQDPFRQGDLLFRCREKGRRDHRGRRRGHRGQGHFVRPTLFTGAKPDMRIAQEEIFGPVLTAITFKDEDEALEIANGVRIRPDRLCLDQRPDPRAALHREAGSGHDLGELGKRPPPADALRRRQGQRHRPRRRRLVLRVLHGAEAYRLRHRPASHSAARKIAGRTTGRKKWVK
jgi:5-carboxymethyl-2-hydroxymuconic-semialdehyde dehydrogenase